MTKTELKMHLLAGGTLEQVLEFGPGEDCEIYKAQDFETGDKVLYIPDTVLNQVPVNTPITNEEAIDDTLAICYSGDDFLAAAQGNLELAKRLFFSCTWQHPTSCLDDMDDDQEGKSD